VTRRARPPGERGEVWVRGPELFVGYADAEQTRAATHRGWFRTGDLGVVDEDGWLTIVGRLKDIIIRGGENIAAGEVELHLEAHPRVHHAVAVGYPDDRLGERVCAFVVADGEFDLAECQRWFAERGVARFKTPERVVQIDALPLLVAGKPDRARLREQAASLA
jgi:non-ribosomal peptide synthetase component E (peptide arylation enzyme)